MTNNRDAQLAVLVDEKAERRLVLSTLPRGQVNPSTHCLQRIHLLDLLGTDEAERFRFRVALNYN